MHTLHISNDSKRLMFMTNGSVESSTPTVSTVAGYRPIALDVHGDSRKAYVALESKYKLNDNFDNYICRNDWKTDSATLVLQLRSTKPGFEAIVKLMSNTHLV